MPNRPEFRARCAAVRAQSNVAATRQILVAAGIRCRSLYALATDLHRRGFTPYYVAAWIQERIHKGPVLIYAEMMDPPQMERRPGAFDVDVGRSNRIMQQRVKQLAIRTMGALWSFTPHDRPEARQAC